MIVAPIAMRGGGAGVMAMAVITAGVTVSVAGLDILPLNEAVMLLVPTSVPVAMPPVVVLKVAIAVSLEVQITEPEMLPSMPSV